MFSSRTAGYVQETSNENAREFSVSPKSLGTVVHLAGLVIITSSASQNTNPAFVQGLSSGA